MPDITVLMSVYNGEKFLAAAIESILGQSFNDFEFLIINDGSTDESTNILRHYAEQDERIVLIEQDNHGLVYSLNKGLEAAQAALIARMDADDIALPARLETQKNYMNEHPDIGVLGSAVIVIDDHDQAFSKMVYPENGPALDDYLYHRGSPLAHPAVMMRREVAQSAGGYRSAYKHAEDYDLWLRLHKVTKIDNLQTPLLRYRQHKDKISIQNAGQQALASVVAREAAKANVDPTAELESISAETLNLFDTDRNKLEWDIIDITASALLLSPVMGALRELEAKMPRDISKDSKPIAARVFLKFSYTAFKNQAYSLCVRHAVKALCVAPIATLYLLLEKIS